MKRTVLALVMLMIANIAGAIPAKPGVWQTLKLTDGTEVRARLCGDEHVHFWMTEDGTRYVESGGTYTLASEALIKSRAMNRRTMAASSQMRKMKKAQSDERNNFIGTKKGLVILAQFTDVKFKTANDSLKYTRILNEPGYSEGSFKGSVSDYFKDQSAGLFELDFDVMGPVTLKNNQKYYGQNDANGNDMHPEEMIIEGCKVIDAMVDFKDYDWDGDGEVDEVFVVYAGKGEADGGSTNTVWPHMYAISEATGKDLILDGVKINVYACSNEITPNGAINGIGTFCHEFSHCMGFPDFYDTAYQGWFGMGDFDLMCGGAYNGDGFCPAGYTAYEKMVCGWQDPIVLADKDTVITDLQPMGNHGETFIIYNDAHPDEYFMIENRQKVAWDASYPAKGLMITHVDYDEKIWYFNCPNTQVTKNSEEYRDYGYPLNDHQRMTIIHADNDDDSKYFNKYSGYYSKTTLSTDLYPYKTLDSLNASSKPAPTLYNKNAAGKNTVEWGIKDIKQNVNGTMSFRYVAKDLQEEPTDTTAVDTTTVDPHPGEYLFYETFDQCNGKGGNDGQWSGSIANSGFIADNEGWLAQGDKMSGAYKCAKFGTSSVVGIATTPTFTLNGKATLTFKAGAWNSSKDGTDLLVECDNGTITPNSFTIEKGQWTECKATIEGDGEISLTFTPTLRFFLDDVAVTDNNGIDGIETIKAVTTRRIYTLDGRYVGIDLNAVGRGIYVVNGKKIVK